MRPDSIFSVLADLTRLRALMLIQSEREVCVCELTFALNESQPKVSRHLALMREAGIVTSRREGIWMYYRLNPDLPDWAREIIRHVHDQIIELSPHCEDLKQLQRMNNRPERICV